jgi:hypothetical protein
VKVTIYHFTIPRSQQFSTGKPTIADQILFGFDPQVRMLAICKAWEENSTKNPEQDMSYVKVADVEVDDLEHAFSTSNHIDSSWQENPNVLNLYKSHPRSTSVGDIMVTGEGKTFYVDSFGFKEI